MHDHTVQICEIEKPYHHEFVLAKDDDEEAKNIIFNEMVVRKL